MANRIYQWPADADDPALRQRLAPTNDALPDDVIAAADAIIEQVRAEGDDGLIALTERFDQVKLTASTLRVTAEEIAASAENAPPMLRKAIDRAAANIRRFHEPQRPVDSSVPTAGGGQLELRWFPVGAAALYVPGGRAAYPSSVLMNAIPAQVAGVERIAAFTVPGTVESNPAVAYALQLLGVDEVYRVAGAQAIAAAAYGTATVEPFDVIVGPGNAYVAAAKRQVYGRVGIDSIAGPSEVLILADESANPEYVAHDLLAQAEHDPVARCVLASTSSKLVDDAIAALERLLDASPRAEIARPAWQNHGLAIVADSRRDLVDICSAMAPEHLQVILTDPPGPDEPVAGAMFFGNDAPTAIGDYIAGPNHVLPTGASARFSGPLGVLSFMRTSSVVRGTRAMMAELAELGATIADYESLDGHAGALRARVEESS